MQSGFIVRAAQRVAAIVFGLACASANALTCAECSGGSLAFTPTQPVAGKGFTIAFDFFATLDCPSGVVTNTLVQGQTIYIGPPGICVDAKSSKAFHYTGTVPALTPGDYTVVGIVSVANGYTPPSFDVVSRSIVLGDPSAVGAPTLSWWAIITASILLVGFSVRRLRSMRGAI